MNSIRKRQELLRQKALDYLYKAFPNDEYYHYFYGQITMNDYAQDIDNYKRELAMFKLLFSCDNEDFKTVLWNRLTYWLSVDSKFNKNDFSAEEYNFVMQAVSHIGKTIYNSNINSPIVTTRLMLRPVEKEDFRLLQFHFKKDGDYANFSGDVVTISHIKHFAKSRQNPLYFTIVETHSSTVIGYIGLHLQERSNSAMLEYYIFKEYRRLGYCKEAVKSLIDSALNNKLYVPIETIRDGIFRRKKIKISTIRAQICSKNLASIKTMLSCGFISEATIHKARLWDSNWEDLHIFYLTNEIYNITKSEEKL